MEDLEWKVGDLVWTRVQGFPWWPGQVSRGDQTKPGVAAICQIE